MAHVGRLSCYFRALCLSHLSMERDRRTYTDRSHHHLPACRQAAQLAVWTILLHVLHLVLDDSPPCAPSCPCPVHLVLDGAAVWTILHVHLDCAAVRTILHVAHVLHLHLNLVVDLECTAVLQL